MHILYGIFTVRQQQYNVCEGSYNSKEEQTYKDLWT